MRLTKAQKERRKAFQTSYETFHEGNKCYYCGQKADTIDHVPAVSVAYEIGLEALTERDIKLYKVSACRECNCILGDKPLLTLGDRARYVYSRLQKRYKRILASEEWLDEEIDELGACLRSYVLSYHNIQLWVERRLQYMEDLFYDVLADQE